jgi:phosphoribosylglycinamide formyltransferase-1
MNKPGVLIFASGSSEGGGSGFENLVGASRTGLLNSEIVGVVSNHENGGVRERADRLGIPFFFFSKPWTSERYQYFAEKTKTDFFALSGWLKLVVGLDPRTRFNSKTVFNIHPGPLPQFGGPGLYGHHVHEAVIEAFHRGEIKYSAVSMHFVSAEYDRGPIFFQLKTGIRNDDTPHSLAQRINKLEHEYQPKITNMVVNGLIRWDGVNSDSLELPQDYSIESFV